MKVVIQKVKEASVSVNNDLVGSILKGFVIMLGVAPSDEQDDIDFLINKIIDMRIFENEEAKFDKTLDQVKGELLIISQFTLFADFSKGRRPYFGNAAKAKKAKILYRQFVQKAKEELGVDRVAEGVFGAKMNVDLINDGPVTLILDTKDE